VHLNCFFSDGCASDICDWTCLPSLRLGSHDDYSPTSPSLRPLVASGSLIRCKLVKVYHHHLCSEGCALNVSCFGGGWPLQNIQSPTSHSIVSWRSCRISSPSSDVATILSLSFWCHYCTSVPSVVSSQPSVRMPPHLWAAIWLSRCSSTISVPDMRGGNNFNMFRHSSNIKVISSIMWEAVMFVLLMGGVYKVCHWDGLRWLDIHNKFHEDG
jgi:hypothetical protein